MSKVYFVRHVLSGNPKRLVGYDSPIGDVGKLQLVEVADFFKDNDMVRVFHSPLIRAKETAVAHWQWQPGWTYELKELNK